MSDACTRSITRPRILFGPVDHAGADGVLINVPSASQQVLIGLDWAAFESRFPQCSAPAVHEIQPSGMPAREPLHGETEAGFAIARVDDEVYVIAHQAIGVDLQFQRFAEFRECSQIVFAIGIAEEDVMPAVSTLKYMMREIWKCDPGDSWHPCLRKQARIA